jgi:NADH/NAD ratio-sensing transcriptional regulator Rex
MLLEAGIRGVVSFSSVELPIQHHKVWYVRLDLKNELRVLSSLISLQARGNAAMSAKRPLQE